MKQRRAFPVVEVTVAAAAVALLVAAAYLTQNQREAASSKYDSLSTYDAASGGYRAWYELLQREGVRVERFERRPAFLDPSVDVYVSASNAFDTVARAERGVAAEFATPGDWDALAKWVKAGGHLVWLADGVTQPEFMKAPPLQKAGPSEDGAVTIIPVALSTGVRSVSGTSRLRVPFATSTSAAPIIADDTGGVVVSYPFGSGTVTIVADESLFQNGRLSRADNARLAYDLATTGLTPHGSVAFDEWSHGFVAGDSWWSILPRQMQIAIVAVALALVLLAIGTALRFGPTARLPDVSERTSAEYLTSMALLYQRGRAVRSAIREMADACIRDVAAGLGLPESAAAKVIALRAGGTDDGPGEEIMELDRLRSFEYPHEADLMRAARLCTALRKEFVHYGRIGIGRRATSSRRTA
jgi:uncharacterized protein DUF4350